MENNTRTGILWTGAEKVLIYGITFVQSIILARLLSPNDFGLSAMLGIFIGVGGVLAESGLGTALVVTGRGENAASTGVERRVLLWNVGIATAMYVVLAIGAPGIAAWYGKPILKPLMWVMAASMIINAASVVSMARLQREQRFDRLAWVNCISTVTSSSVAIALALAGCGVWAIACLGLSLAVVRTLLAWCFSHAERGIRMDGNAKEKDEGMRRSDFRGLLSYGWKLTVSGLIHTAYCNIFQIVIGKMWSPSAVGLFVRGLRWAQLPAEVVNESVGRVALPKLALGQAEKRGEGGKWIVLNALLLWPGLAVLWIWAPEIVRMVLGPKWLDCVPYMRILILGQVLSPITNIALKVLYARGRSDAVLKSDFIKKPLGLAALGVGCFFGLAGLCWAKVVSDIAECVTDMWYVVKGRKKKEDGKSDGDEIDLVYCWCNGKMFEGLERCRFSENGELKRSLASVDRYAPWFRRIYLFVNDGTEIPAWLEAHPKVRIVRHSEVIPKEVLPLRNAGSIEFWMYRLPGLAERFVYGNDDTFFGARVRPEDFFDAKGRMICRYKLGVRLSDVSGGGTYDAELRNNRALLKSDNDKFPHHGFDPYLKSVIEDFWTDYPADALRSASYPERSREQLQRDVFALYAMKTGRGVEGPVKVGWRWISLYAELCDRKARWRIRLMRPKMYCLNDSERCTERDRESIS